MATRATPLEGIVHSSLNHPNGPDKLVAAGLLKELKRLRINVKTWREACSGKSLLHFAAASNQVEVINYLASVAKLNINLQASDGNTPLHLAVTKGHTEATKAILSLGADDNICNSDMDPPLHVAIKQGSQGIGVLSEFVKHPSVNLSVRGFNDYSPLHVIAKTNNLEAMGILYESLKDNGSSHIISQRDKNGLTSFHIAAQAGAHDILEYLFSKCPNHNLDSKQILAIFSSESRSPLHYAVEHRHTQCVRVLLKYGADPTHRSGERCAPPVHLACWLGNLAALKVMVEICGLSILLSRGQEDKTALHNSTSISSKELISYLVENGVGVNDVDENEFTPLSIAVQQGNANAVEELLRLGADPLIKDKWGNNTLHRAVLEKRIKTFKAVLSCDSAAALASSADNDGNYPIHLALKLGVAEMVFSLMEVTPETFQDSELNNYLHLAATSGDERILTHLLNSTLSQSMINGANSEGLTPLHCAALGSDVTAVRKLTDHGAVIHRCNSGLTPFMCACSKGNHEAARFLYHSNHSNQFQCDWTDHSGNTPLHAAVDGGSHQLITFCLEEGMPITLNNYQLSFLDKILDQNETKLAKVVFSHKRWVECIDVYCPSKPHPILRIVDQMPGIYGTILDNSVTKSPLNPGHRDYWEEFNFKCLDLEPEPSLVQGEEMEGQVRRQVTTEAVELTKLNDAYSETNIGIAIRSLPKYQSENTQGRRGFSGWLKSMGRKRDDSLSVVRKLIKNNDKSHLLHPVVMSYIKMKWEGLGMYFHGVTMLIYLLLAIFFSIFVASIPQPLQSPDSMLTYENGNNNSNSSMDLDSDSISTGATVLLYVCLVLGAINMMASFFQFYLQGIDIILDIKSEWQTWSTFIAASSVLIFLVSILVGGLESALWNAAAIGVSFAWISFNLSLQLICVFDLGVYITMMLSTTMVIFKVAIVFLALIFSFTFAFYILVGTVEELHYNTVGLSLYSILHSIIATTDYLGFASLEQAGELRFSVLVFILLVFLILLLPIVFLNVLIGLAVGDIASIQKEAVLYRQEVEVRALSRLNMRYMPNWCRKHISKRSLTNYSNRSQSQCGSLLSKIFHKTLSSSEMNAASEDDQLKELRQELTEEREYYQKSLDQLQEKVISLASDQSLQLDGMLRLEDMVAKIMTAHAIK